MKFLGEMLVERGAISTADLDKAQQIKNSVGGRLGALLVANGAVSEDIVLATQAERLGVAYLRADADLPEEVSVYRFMAESPVKLDWFLDNAVLLWRCDDGLCCLARDIEDRALREALGYFYPGDPVTFCLAANHQIDRLLDFVRKERAIEDLFSSDNAMLLREMAEEAPIIELVNNLLAQAVDVNASDIHVEPAEEHFAVRLRVDGVLRTPPNATPRSLPRGGVAHQADRRPRYRRAPLAAGRPHFAAHRWQGYGHPRVYRAVRLRRVDRAAPPGPAKRRFRVGAIGHGSGPLGHIPRLAGGQQRHRPRHRAHRLRQVHHLGRRVGGNGRRHQEDHYRRGPGGVSDAEHHADPSACGDRLHVRACAAAHPPARPGRHHGGRDPRFGNRRHRDPLGPHRPLGAVYRPHQRRPSPASPA